MAIIKVTDIHDRDFDYEDDEVTALIKDNTVKIITRAGKKVIGFFVNPASYTIED